MPDLFGLGPDMPISETIKRRFFGEESTPQQEKHCPSNKTKKSFLREGPKMKPLAFLGIGKVGVVNKPLPRIETKEDNTIKSLLTF